MNKETMLQLLSNKKKLTWYCCGPTIYNNSHLGHARTYITFDIIRRILLANGHDISYTMNITNIDDKILNIVNALNPDTDAITKQNFYKEYILQKEQEFIQDLTALNILLPDTVTRVTDFIPQIQTYIQQIIDNGYAYLYQEETGTTSVYFDYEKYVTNGNNFFPLVNKQGQHLYNESDQKEDAFLKKKHQYDFALWKGAKVDEAIYFDSPWTNDKHNNNNPNNSDLTSCKAKGLGRPGWHIECSAMCESIHGPTLDIHSGGIDLLMPHHNNEVVQHIAYHGLQDNKWCNNFIHSGPLTVDGKKMSQSLGNFITIRSFLGANVNNNDTNTNTNTRPIQTLKGTADDLRMLFSYHDWKTPLDYSQDSLNYAKKKVQTLITFIRNVTLQVTCVTDKTNDNNDKVDEDFYKKYTIYKNTIDNYLYPNLDISNAFQTLFALVKETNIHIKDNNCEKTSLICVLEYVKRVIRTLGFTFVNVAMTVDMYGSTIVNADVTTNNNNNDNAEGPSREQILLSVLLTTRNNIRSFINNNKKNFNTPELKANIKELYKITDTIRTDLKDLGYCLEDSLIAAKK